ncbi:MAG: hypothetical protein ACRC6T_01335 [Sarcina sp.]
MAVSKKRKIKEKTKKIRAAKYTPLTKYANNPLVINEIRRCRKFYNDFLLNSVDGLIDECDTIIADIVENDFHDFYNDGRTYDNVVGDIEALIFGNISRKFNRGKNDREVRIAMISSLLMGAKLGANGKIDFMPAIIFEKVMRRKYSKITKIEFALKEFPIVMDSGCMPPILHELMNKMNELSEIFEALILETMYDRVDKYLDEINIYKDIEDMFLKVSKVIGSSEKVRIVEFMIANKCSKEMIESMKGYIDDVASNADTKEEEILFTKEERKPTHRSYIHRTYKELNTMAVDSGYKLIRCHGDHGIFSNDSGEVMIIPQGRDIGKGLQIQIVKKLSQ